MAVFFHCVQLVVQIRKGRFEMKVLETGNLIHKLLIADNYLENNFSHFLLVNASEVI